MTLWWCGPSAQQGSVAYHTDGVLEPDWREREQTTPISLLADPLVVTGSNEQPVGHSAPGPWSSYRITAAGLLG